MIMEDNKEIVAVLNDLIKINTDRITGYAKAVENIDSSEFMLKSLFYQVTDESQEIKERLSEKVIALGGEPANGSTAPGKIYHVWMDIQATFSGDATTSTLAVCEFGEDAVQRAYKEAVAESKDFPDDIQHMIKNQQHLLKMSHDLIRNQRDQNQEVVN